LRGDELQKLGELLAMISFIKAGDKYIWLIAIPLAHKLKREEHHRTHSSIHGGLALIWTTSSYIN
jgi:hypothetical protein